MMRTANPTLHDTVFAPAQTLPGASARPLTMTIQGTVNKTFILLCICAATAIFAWNKILPAAGQVDGKLAMMFTTGGALGGLVLGLVLRFKPRASPVLAPLYAGIEGLFVGGISAVYASMFAKEGTMLNTGLVLNAALLTFAVLGALLLAYSSRLIKPTENLKLGIAAATGGIMLFYLASFVLGFFGIHMSVLSPSNSSMLSIGISLVMVVVASLNLVLDFDFIEEGAARGAPKHMEWYAGFGLLVTLVWLYVEMLRLLAKLQSRD